MRSPEPTQTIGEDDRWLINWFFARLKIVYEAKFAAQYATPDDVALGKREWSTMILKYSKPELERAIELAKQQRLKGDKDYDWPDIPKILGLVARHYIGPESSRDQRRPMIEDFSKKARREKVQNETLTNLKDLFK